MAGIGIILNPKARSYKHNPGRMERLGFIVGDKASCHATQDVLDVEALAKEFKEKEIEILGISGGDGTNHVTLTTFINVYGDKPLPKVAFLRGGTMNNVANALGVKGLPEKFRRREILWRSHPSLPDDGARTCHAGTTRTHSSNEHLRRSNIHGRRTPVFNPLIYKGACACF